MRILTGKLLLAGLLSAVFSAVFAQTAVQDPPSTVVVPTGGSSQPESRLVSRFSGFAGSEDNAHSLVTGLRQGNAITLNPTPAEGSPVGESVRFTPATRPMGYGNVRIALALAQEQLAQNGVTQPTPDQIRAALAGGTIASGTGEPGSTTRLQGVLQMRADGMGWGQIANGMGVKLGAVMSGRASVPATTVSTTAAGNSTTATRSNAGITTAAGAAAVNARGNSASARSGVRPSGIVTASGGSATNGAGAGAYGGVRGGVSTAAGAGGGNGQGLAKGHARN